MKKNILIIAGAILGFLVLSYAFVPQVLKGKIVNQSDISGWQGMAHETIAWNADHPDNPTAWTESMFGGMPTVCLVPPTKGDITKPIYDFLLSGRRPATYIFVSLLGAFLMFLSFGVHPLVAAGGAIAVSFCSYNMQIIQVGHNTKMQAIAFLPWVLAALVFTYRSARGKGEKRKWLPGTLAGAAFFGLTVSFQVKANHPQISYYLAIIILFYAIVEFARALKEPDRKSSVARFFGTSALLLALGVVGIGTNATKLLPTFEYTPYSMRGGSSDKKDDGANAGAKGLKLDYATAWSYGWEELPNLVIPNYNGGSSSGAVNPDRSETYKLLKRAGQSNVRAVCKHLPMYWGPQPFTAGPMYMGAITVFLFLLGLMYYRGRDKWWIVAASIVAVLLSVGSNFMFFTKLFYDFAPMYNKFRTVSMSLVVLQFTLPLLGFLMLDRVLKGDGVTRKQILQAAALSLGLYLAFALIQSAFGSFSAAADAGQQDVLVKAFRADRRQLLWADAWRSMAFVAVAAAVILWGLGKNASKGLIAVGAVSLLVLADMFAVGRRYLSEDDFVTPKQFSNQFEQRPVDKMILKDTDPSYRVLDLTVNVFNDSHPSYWHKNIGGYSPVKMQRYQEYIESRLEKEINSVYKVMKGAKTLGEIEASLPCCEGLSMLNCKYIIVGEDIPPVRNHYAKGPAWFKNGEGRVMMTSYAPNRLEYRYSSEGEGEIVFSEVYYPKGWKLVLDGREELPIDLYGNLFRSAKVPAGEHQLVMTFDPQSYNTGSTVSLACSLLLILLVLGGAAARFRYGKK